MSDNVFTVVIHAHPTAFGESTHQERERIFGILSEIALAVRRGAPDPYTPILHPDGSVLAEYHFGRSAETQHPVALCTIEGAVQWVQPAEAARSVVADPERFSRDGFTPAEKAAWPAKEGARRSAAATRAAEQTAALEKAKG